jgi:alpha-tubulin suppressor-like RCC1 family protein
MVAVRKRGSVRLTRWVLTPLTVAVSLLGLGGPVGASGSPNVAAATLANVLSVAGDSPGGAFCAVLSTGHVDCWGYNSSGQLSNGTTTSSDVPVSATGITNAKGVTTDGDGGSFCAVLSTGHVDCWGFNNYGELGNGTTTSSDVPVAVKSISTATAVTGSQLGFCVRP